MATRFPQIKPISITLDPFARVEQEIRSFFDTIIRKATIRRDELLQQLNNLKQDYLCKEEARKRQVRDFEHMIEKFDDMSIQKNSSLVLNRENIEETKGELRKAEQPTPVPVLYFNTKDLQSLLTKLEWIGTVQEVSRLYFDKMKPVGSIGKFGMKKDELSLPLGIRIDEGENIYVCDSGNSRIQIFSKLGKFLTEFGKGQLVSPHDIALKDGWAFVSDSRLCSILKFQTSNFKLIEKSVRVLLRDPYGLTVDRDEVLVADNDNNRIAVLNLDLQYLREIGKGVLEFPCDVKADLNRIFVVDRNTSHNVHVFSKSADLLYSMISVKKDSVNFLVSDMRAEGVMFMCLDQFGNLIISESEDKSVQIFTLEGQLIHSIQCEGFPRGIVVTNNNTIVCGMSYSIMFY